MLKVIAIGIPNINEYERERIQEMLDGVHPLSSHVKKYDTGTKRKTVLDQSPAGRAETGGPGDTLSHDDVSSGYNKGLNPGGRADDETGPGNSSTMGDGEQTFNDSKTVELITKNDFDTSSSMSPLNYESSKWDQKTSHINLKLREVYKKPGIGSFPKRHSVDELAKAANSVWSYNYRV